MRGPENVFGEANLDFHLHFKLITGTTVILWPETGL